jgi:hypothetical protein
MPQILHRTALALALRQTARPRPRALWTISSFTRPQYQSLTSRLSSTKPTPDSTPNPNRQAEHKANSLNGNGREKGGNPNPELPPFSFKDLGASRKVKIVVVAFLAIVGMLEASMYGRWAWKKFGGRKDVKEERAGE